MKLTENHIKQLYKFTREHFVYHYDVQTELVDHLANDIEQIWEAQPLLTFEQARDVSFKKFGVFGFMEVVEQKQKSMGKKYWKIILQFAKDWFQLPKIVATFAIFSLLFQLFRSNVSEFIFVGIILCYFVFGMIKRIQLKSRFKKRKKVDGKTWMLERLIFSQGVANAAVFPLYTFQIFIHTSNLNNVTIIWGLLLALFYTAIFIIGYISLVVIPSKAEELLKETYPEYFMI
ncbi:hypothetical protein KCTC32516_00783 [Polaribacter huanghezhanensis]|uniref:hypothetical protein n=1 Tax=Polaribacter huanghezhanensis TaxID=1354726 RepID=UPI0026494E6E|nr:hypothetical protein [Polaribacter huanghezhanensis]WKD85443.1 hypothetical protein KCTC32516_00783 [Polaribacter huanghezhanensis]